MTDRPDPDPTAASPWVVRFALLVPDGGPVLDVACGSGRHSRFFLGLGRHVVALDRDVSEVADLRADPSAEVVEADLEDGSPWPFPGWRFAGIVVTNYLHRPLFPALIEAVAPGGVLIYETFGRGHERFGHPRNPDHLLEAGELLDVVRGQLQVVAYEHGETRLPRKAVVQRLCATRDLPCRPHGGGPPPAHSLDPARD